MYINVVIAGDEYTGKSYISYRFQNLEFSENHYPTHGTNIKKIDYITDDGIKYLLKIRDTPGMDKYRNFQIEQLKQANIILLVYDVTDQESFDSIKNKWFKILKEEC